MEYVSVSQYGTGAVKMVDYDKLEDPDRVARGCVMDTRQQEDLEMMTNPSRWPLGSMLPLKRHNPEAEGVMKQDYGLLIDPGVAGRFVWYEGAQIGTQPSHEIMEGSRMMLAPHLEELINEGWTVD